MSHFFRPLWKLLLETAVPDDAPPLTCPECFAILEYLAALSPTYDSWPNLIEKVQQHLATCPDCQAYYQKRLDEFNTLLPD